MNLAAGRRAAFAFALGAAGCQRPDLWCEGGQCACEADDECVVTPYGEPVTGPEDCYCDDVSCGGSVPRSAVGARANEAEWRLQCETETEALCAETAHCVLHAPERAACRQGTCVKLVDED